MSKHKLLTYLSGLVISLSLVVITVINAVQIRQPVSTASQARNLAQSIFSTGLIIPTKTPSQLETDQDLTRLYNSLPVSQPTFKIAFDYYRDKYLVTFVGDVTLAQKNFQSWLTTNNYSSLYPTYFSFSTTIPSITDAPKLTPTSTPVSTLTPVPTSTAGCTGKKPVCIDCIQCVSGVWTCVSCNAVY